MLHAAARRPGDGSRKSAQAWRCGKPTSYQESEGPGFRNSQRGPKFCGLTRNQQWSPNLGSTGDENRSARTARDLKADQRCQHVLFTFAMVRPWSSDKPLHPEYLAILPVLYADTNRLITIVSLALARAPAQACSPGSALIKQQWNIISSSGIRGEKSPPGTTPARFSGF